MENLDTGYSINAVESVIWRIASRAQTFGRMLISTRNSRFVFEIRGCRPAYGSLLHASTFRYFVYVFVARLSANFPSHFPSIIPIETAIKINRSLAGLPLGSSRFSLLAYLFFLLIRKEREKETKREREKDIGKNMMDNPCSLLFRL